MQYLVKFERIQWCEAWVEADDPDVAGEIAVESGKHAELASYDDNIEVTVD